MISEGAGGGVFLEEVSSEQGLTAWVGAGCSGKGREALQAEKPVREKHKPPRGVLDHQPPSRSLKQRIGQSEESFIFSWLSMYIPIWMLKDQRLPVPSLCSLSEHK